MALRGTCVRPELLQGMITCGRSCAELQGADSTLQQLSNMWHQLNHSRCFASKGSDAKRRGTVHKGTRYGIKLQEEDPALFERMRTILGYYDLSGRSARKPPAPPTSVRISMLQTQRYLDLPEDLKQWLMHYKVVSLNRQLEGMHSQTLQYLTSLQEQPKNQAEGGRPSAGPAGLAAMLQRAKKQSGQSSS